MFLINKLALCWAMDDCPQRGEQHSLWPTTSWDQLSLLPYAERQQ